ncbi:hypothetical protein EYF80_000326 [Liparis tanakae]|uniref:Uncharacterized protein n=1 Tax=Liparis tanakae TaxID=230148 RepID=A0A4Z2JIS6_9TELE|nr:hypothetical protein EYF80_000326 [Liparis tanakae]
MTTAPPLTSHMTTAPPLTSHMTTAHPLTSHMTTEGGMDPRQRERAGHVPREDFVGDPSEAARVPVGGDDAEDLGAGRRVAADAHGVAVGVEHRSVVVQVLHLDVDVGLSAQASLGLGKWRKEDDAVMMLQGNSDRWKPTVPLTGSSALIRMSWIVCPESRSIS